MPAGDAGSGSLWKHAYDNRNELTGASRFWSDWTPVTGQQYGYGFGNIGNRASSLVGSKRPLGSYLNKAPRREDNLARPHPPSPGYGGTSLNPLPLTEEIFSVCFVSSCSSLVPSQIPHFQHRFFLCALCDSARDRLFSPISQGLAGDGTNYWADAGAWASRMLLTLPVLGLISAWSAGKRILGVPPSCVTVHKQACYLKCCWRVPFLHRAARVA